eukprot:6989-Pelagomonas_calceolata.AAC.3
MNRLFFRPEHCGLTKTDAAAKVGLYPTYTACALCCRVFVAPLKCPDLPTPELLQTCLQTSW